MSKKAILLTILFAVLTVSSAAFSADQIKQIDRPQQIPSFLGYVPDRFIVVMKPEVGNLKMTLSPNNVVHIGDAEFDKICDRFAVSGIKRQFPGAEKSLLANGAELARYHKIRFETGTLEDAMEAYRNNPMVEKVEPIGIHTMYATPNDFYYSYQWHLNQTSDHDIDAPEAWDIEAGSTSTIVAILDSGTRYYHPDLGGANASVSNPGASRGNMWINTAELNGSSGVDDDGNGYVDDWIGYDFIQSTTSCWPGEDCSGQDNDPRDFNGHGTHTSGIFGMMTNDNYGMCGVAGGWGNGTQTEYGNGVKIMPLRMGYSYNYLGQEYGVVLMDAAAEAFYYAADNGARIASCSWGSSNSGGIGAAATYFLNSGGIICVAAGNDGAETSPDYLNGRGDCISVAATNETDNGASFTTYGTWVDICAPGNNIYSTYHDHTDPNTTYWAAMSGTSMATPMVAGVCALIWSQNPSWTAAQVKNQLFSSADNIDAYLSSKYIGKMGAGRINAYNAVNTGPPPAPVANFSGSPTSGTEPLTVNFTDLSTGSITGWNWTFGDGGTSLAQNPSHQYTSAGTYTVSLTVTGPGGSDDETKTNYITVNPCVLPTAGFVGNPTSGEVPLTVNFTNQSSGATSYSWTFGDGGTSTATNPNHNYTSGGTYTVTLTATNSCGNDIFTRTNYITVTCTPPVAGFVGSPTSGDYPLNVSFTDQSTGATSWSWTFGDGGTSTQQNPSHNYTSAGIYTVALTVTNSCGNDTETKTDYITVTEPPCYPPVADFIGSPTSGEYNLPVNFTDLSTNSPTSWSWTFGDGGTSMAQNPSHTYTAAGTYTVSLTATNSCGSDGETKIDYITVTEPAGWTVITYDDFESGWGNYTDGGSDCSRYTGGTYAHQGSAAADIQDNSGTASSFYHTANYDVSGYTDLEVEFWFYAYSMETNEDFWLQYYDGSTWRTVETWASGTDFNNNTFYNKVVTISSGTYNFPSNAGIRFMCDASNNSDDVYIDEIEFRGSGVQTPPPPTAEFVGTPTTGFAPLTVNFTDQSTDNPTSWSWTFGDGGTSTAQNPSHQYTVAGTYTVSLTATNAYGNDTKTKTDYITVAEAGQNVMHVHDIVVTRSGSRRVRGAATITIYDLGGSPVSGAAVYADYTGPNSGSVSGNTNTSGQVTLQTAFRTRPSGEWCFTVTNVTKSDWTYDAGSNVVTEACESGYVAKAGDPAASLLPTEFGLAQNQPNPFNPITDISFALPAATHVTLEIFNVLGQRVTVLADGEFEAGIHTVSWDASRQASGIYFYRLQADKFVASKKMLLLK